MFPPALKKGMVRLLKKGALLARGKVSKGHFRRAATSKWALFLSARRAHKLSTVIKFNTVAVFSVFCLFLRFSLSFVLSSVSIFQDSLLPEATPTLPCLSKYQRTIGPENAHLKPDLGVLSHNEMTLTLNTHTPLLTS